MAEPPALDVWIDGDCDVCRRSRDWCSIRDGRRRLHFVDLHTSASDQPPGSAEAMMRAVHVRLADGTIETGFDAWRRILAELDGWRWVAWAAGLPGVKHLGGIVYSMVARNRHQFGVART